MARRITSDMFPNGVDWMALRRGDECDLRTVSQVCGYLGNEPQPENWCGAEIVQNKDAYTKHYLAGERLYHTFFRDSEHYPFSYEGLCLLHSIDNRHPRTAQKVFIISQYHAKTQEEMRWNALFAAALARELFLDYGDFPIVPHLYFPQFMVDEGLERGFGIEAGHMMMDICDRVLLAVIDNRISEGMEADIMYATERLGFNPERRDFTKEHADNMIQDHIGDILAAEHCKAEGQAVNADADERG